jgi:hypothetical protein
VMDHRCPHRCASLFLGRNEEGGIRCIYHGWNTTSRATVSTWRVCLRTRISSIR